MAQHRQNIKGSWRAAALLPLLLLTGCARFRSENTAVIDDTAKLEKKAPAVDWKSAGFGGITSESQQIERNLGIR